MVFPGVIGLSCDIVAVVIWGDTLEYHTCYSNFSFVGSCYFIFEHLMLWHDTFEIHLC